MEQALLSDLQVLLTDLQAVLSDFLPLDQPAPGYRLSLGAPPCLSGSFLGTGKSKHQGSGSGGALKPRSQEAGGSVKELGLETGL